MDETLHHCCMKCNTQTAHGREYKYYHGLELGEHTYNSGSTVSVTKRYEIDGSGGAYLCHRCVLLSMQENSNGSLYGLMVFLTIVSVVLFVVVLMNETTRTNPFMYLISVGLGLFGNFILWLFVRKNKNEIKAIQESSESELDQRVEKEEKSLISDHFSDSGDVLAMEVCNPGAVFSPDVEGQSYLYKGRREGKVFEEAKRNVYFITRSRYEYYRKKGKLS